MKYGHKTWAFDAAGRTSLNVIIDLTIAAGLDPRTLVAQHAYATLVEMIGNSLKAFSEGKQRQALWDLIDSHLAPLYLAGVDLITDPSAPTDEREAAALRLVVAFANASAIEVCNTISSDTSIRLCGEYFRFFSHTC